MFSLALPLIYFEKMIRLIFLFIAISGLSAATAQMQDADYKIYDTRQQKEVTLEDITAALPARSVLLFGEEHNDSIGHLLELRIFENLQQRYGKKIVLSLEMFEADVQPVLNEYLAGIISEKNFRKEARSWNNYDDYRPLVELAKQRGIPVVAANAPARYVNLVTRKGTPALGELGKTAKKHIAPLPVDTLTGQYYHRFNEIMGGHSVPGMHLYQSQNFWDATMAHFIRKGKKQHKAELVLHLNGRFHSDYRSGLVERLIGKGEKVTTISCFAAETLENPNWTQHSNLADFVIITKKK